MSSVPRHPARQTSGTVAPPVADWLALRLFGQYRLLLIITTAAVYHGVDGQSTFGGRDPRLFEIVHYSYVGTALLLLVAVWLRRPSAATQFYLQSYADILLVVMLMYASGGVQSGLGPWLLIDIALLSHLTRLRHALLFAAIASLMVLAAELVASLQFGREAAGFERTALLGALLFMVAWLMAVPVRQLAARRLSPPTPDRASLDLEQISQLNEEIVRELDSGVVVVDATRQVILINDTARTLLGVEFQTLPIKLSRLSSALQRSLHEAELSARPVAPPFDIESTGLHVLPQYTPLSSGGMLIKLDDHAHIRQQFQQLRLASLGRLSASMAHEVRNPLGAISHAIQLIGESDTLSSEDTHLLDIARDHTRRIDRIVNDILQLSNRQPVSTAPLELGPQVQGFCERFRLENDLDAHALTSIAEPRLSAPFDPGHLDQVLWNLCTNARLHNEAREIRIEITCHAEPDGTAVLEVRDDGEGVADIDREHLFEPFYSTHHNGSGLGLYIIRELCQLNGATIDYLMEESGARFRITFARARRLAA